MKVHRSGTKENYLKTKSSMHSIQNKTMTKRPSCAHGRDLVLHR